MCSSSAMAKARRTSGRYARESQQYRYQRDPEFAQRRREASNVSHAKCRAAKKAARETAAKEAAAA